MFGGTDRFSLHSSILANVSPLLLMALEEDQKRRPKKVWCLPRSSRWWLETVPLFDDDTFRQEFRMTRDTFRYVLDEIRPDIEKQLSTFREPIEPARRLASFMYYLSTTAEQRTVATLFGISAPSLSQIIVDVSNAINENLYPRFIRMPNDDEIQNVVDGFESRFGLPQCGGAIDGCHIPIMAPTINRNDYYCRKGWYTIIMQAVVDHKYCFRSLNVGWPGSVHDARVFAKSNVFKLGQSGRLFPPITRLIENVQVPIYLIADSAYPALPWLIKPHRFSAYQNDIERNFDFAHSQTRMTVENTFGRLKGRYRRIQKRVDLAVDRISPLVTAAATLHNIIEHREGTFDPQWQDNDDDAFVQPNQIIPAANLTGLSTVQARDTSAQHRRALATYLQNL